MINKIALGAGCFWGVQHYLNQVPGVIKTAVGYMGGHTDHPTYEQVCTGTSGHIEVVLVEYESDQVTLEDILDIFWRIHDPTTPNRQGVDIGPQYQSAIFYTDEKQLETIKHSQQLFDQQNSFNQPSCTKLIEFSNFYLAESYHQDYYKKNNRPVCHYLREKY
jgi:peptide-methionine (S)-S-oxide reductase